MAKITTKKPGQGGPTVTEKEVTSPPISSPEIPIKKPVETAAVPTKDLRSSEKNIPQVKVTRTSEVKLKNFSPPPPTPLPQPPQSKSGSLIVAIGGIVLILASLSKLVPSTPKYESEFLPSDPTAREMLVRDDPSKLASAAWRNEEPGIFGRFFRKLCIGYAKSDGCSQAPLHPFEKVAEQMGIKLSFEKEEDKKVIEQTIEHKSRAFTFGK